MRKLLITLVLGTSLAVPALAATWQPPEEGRSIYVLPPSGQDDDVCATGSRMPSGCTATASSPRTGPLPASKPPVYRMGILAQGAVQ
jgi:hypothetical protein